MTGAFQLEEQVRRRFQQAFGGAPATVAAAPGRMNVIGEHTDYNDGWVLPAAIDRYVAAAVRPRADGQLLCVSDTSREGVRVPALYQSPRGDWVDYIVGVRRQIDTDTGFDVAIAGEIPIGAGLASSAALEVATARAMLAGIGAELAGVELARLCQRVENDFIGARTGIMDPFTALFAKAGSALLLDCRSLEYEIIPLPGARLSWLLADTRVKHALAASAYNQRRAECEAAAAAMGRRTLRDATEADLERLTDPVLVQRARHVVSENGRVAAAATALRANDDTVLGGLLYASHESLKNDFSVSSPELDTLVMLARELDAVRGARMMGGGFGGCVLVLHESNDLVRVKEHLRQGYARRFDRAPEFYPVRSVDGALCR